MVHRSRLQLFNQRQRYFTDAKVSGMKTLVYVFLILVASVANAHSGGVNVSGCHGSKKIGAHCHPERASGCGGSDGTQVARDRRLKRECKGAANAGACLGYTQ